MGRPDVSGAADRFFFFLFSAAATVISRPRASFGSRMGRPDVVFAVPHAACPPDRAGHPCDFAAPAVAEALASLVANSVVLESEVHRDPSQLAADGLPGSDQNRPWGRRSTRFAERLAGLEALEPALVVDVHSFPGPEFGGASVAVLDPPPGDPISGDLVAALRAAGVRAELVSASEVNAVVSEARALGLAATLVEFSESDSASDRSRAVEAVARWASLRVARAVRPL
jgi:hypothetical protein